MGYLFIPASHLFVNSTDQNQARKMLGLILIQIVPEFFFEKVTLEKNSKEFKVSQHAKSEEY